MQDLFNGPAGIVQSSFVLTLLVFSLFVWRTVFSRKVESFQLRQGRVMEVLCVAYLASFVVHLPTSNPLVGMTLLSLTVFSILPGCLAVHIAIRGEPRRKRTGR